MGLLCKECRWDGKEAVNFVHLRGRKYRSSLQSSRHGSDRGVYRSPCTKVSNVACKQCGSDHLSYAACSFCKTAAGKRQILKKKAEAVIAKRKAYEAANPHKLNAKNAKRRAARLRATPQWLSSFHLSQIEYLFQCAKNLEKMNGTKWHVDHIVPLQGKNVCGLHVPWNLRVIKAEENLKKSNKLEQAV